MKLMTTITMLLTLSNSALADDKPADQKTIQGDWKVTSVTRNGENVKAAVGTTFTFSKSTFIGKGKRMMKGTFTLDPQKSPKQLDLKVAGENGQTLVMPAIYKFEKKKLTICSPRRPGKARPTEFKSDADSETTLIVMEKITKAVE